jgi:thioredoxin-related protein
MLRLLLTILIISIISCGPRAKPICNIPTADNTHGAADKYGFKPYDNLDIARQCARVTGRQILIMFTCYSCMATKDEIDWHILADDEVKKIIDGHYILTVLYKDDKSPVANVDSTQNLLNGALIETVGQMNTNIQITLFQTNSQPYYACVDSNLQTISEPFGYTPLNGKERIIRQLTKGIK